MSWFSDLFGRDQADAVEMGLLVADQQNPYAHLTDAEVGQVLDDREALRAARPTYQCDTCANTRRADCEDCEHASGREVCRTCDGETVTGCYWCGGRGERSGEVCEDCGGVGEETCVGCKGSGEVDCPTCEGDGWVGCPVECWARGPDGRFYT